MRLYRQRGRQRLYYDIRLYPTLFDEFVVVHQCAQRACMKKGTREYFATKKEALLRSLCIIEHKRNEGFRPNL